MRIYEQFFFSSESLFVDPLSLDLWCFSFSKITFFFNASFRLEDDSDDLFFEVVVFFFALLSLLVYD